MQEDKLMLSNSYYAKFFGDALLKEIFHLDEELTQAIATKQDPVVEDELEHSLDVALSEADVEGTKLLSEAKKPKYHVYSAYGGTRLSSHHSLAAAHKAAVKHSDKQPVHVWTATGGELGMGKPVAHYSNGKKTVFEDVKFEKDLDSMMKLIIGNQ
jgi:hypothetical protein